MPSPPKIRGITPSSCPPNHPPLSPAIRRLLSPSRNYLSTPNSSPVSRPTTPVIVINPAFSPPPPLFPRYSPFNTPVLPSRLHQLGSKLPQISARWDNLTNTPTYQRSDPDFWASRQLPIPVTSTLSSNLSGFGFTPESDISSEAFVELTVVDCEADQIAGRMIGPSDPTAAAEAGRLGEIRDKIKFGIERTKA